MTDKQIKYIVKNCSSITDGRNIQNICTNANACCELITDCLIKQVIDKCMQECNPLNNEWNRVKENLSNEILQLFEIEEFEQ